MRFRTLIAISLFLVLMIASIAFAGNGGGYQVPPTLTSITLPTGWHHDLSYSNGQFLANGSNGEVLALLSGSWQGRGIYLKRPAWINSGIAGYDEQGYPSIWNGAEVRKVADAQFGSGPFTLPVCNANGDAMFARFQTNFVVRSNASGSTSATIPFYWGASWWTTSIAMGRSNGRVAYVAGQETTNPINGGYRVARLFDNVSGDTGMAYSEIAIGGNHLFGVLPDHSGVEAWSLNADDSVIHKDWTWTGGYFNLLGSDRDGAMIRQGSLIWKADYAPVPEPSSMLILGSGLLGLGGIIRRRK